MATKSKTAAKKPAARKPVATHHKHVPAKGKVSKEAVKPHAKPAATHAPAKKIAPTAAEAKPHAKPAATHRAAAESVSLIDKKHPEKKPADGELKKKATFLPPISRIRASLETPAAPPPKKSEPAPTPKAEPKVEAAPAEAEAQNVIHIKPPIIVKEFAAQLGLKPFQLIKELMDDFTVFANQNQTIEPDVATKIAEKHGLVLEKERREKGGGVHKV